MSAQTTRDDDCLKTLILIEFDFRLIIITYHVYIHMVFVLIKLDVKLENSRSECLSVAVLALQALL